MSIEALRDRMAELSDLTALARLAAWDQRTMMPPEGGAERGEQLATLERLAHERATGDEVGEWLAALEAEDLDGIDAEIVRLARRDFDRARRVPGRAGGGARARVLGGPDDLAGARARPTTSRRSRRRCAATSSSRASTPPASRASARPYDALLADYDYGLTAARVQEVFGELSEALAPLVADAARNGARARRWRRPRRRAAAPRPRRAGAARRRARRLAHRRLGAPVQRRPRAARQPRDDALRGAATSSR